MKLIHKSPRQETSKMSTYEWMDRESMVCPQWNIHGQKGMKLWYILQHGYWNTVSERTQSQKTTYYMITFK